MPDSRDTLAWTLRSSFKLLSPYNAKTPKGEGDGYLTAVLYLSPHTLAGGRTLCPHSTAACRAACLSASGRSGLPKATNARLERTLMFLERRELFMLTLYDDIARMQDIATSNDLRLAIRLNGTSDVLWEREAVGGCTLFNMFPEATFYDYTRVPFAVRERELPKGWRLTYSLADAPASEALPYLRAGHSVAVVVPQEVKDRYAGGSMHKGGEARRFNVVDGDAHDLRFLDPPSSLVLLSPKGGKLADPLLRPRLMQELGTA
jgi:hypothetical protein